MLYKVFIGLVSSKIVEFDINEMILGSARFSLSPPGANNQSTSEQNSI